jgi:predicted phage-related endonuclease
VTGIHYPHDSVEWHAIRAKNIGGSEISALFDLPDDQVPAYMMRRFALWHVKAGNAPSPPVDGVRPKWGLRLEAVIADAVAEEHGWEVIKGGYATDPATPGLGCTLDFVIASDTEEDGPGALETKSIDWLIHKRSWTDDEPPPHVLLQLQHQLAATGYSWGAVAALVGGNDLRLYRYKARPKLIAEIRRRVIEFWASIEAGQPPPVDGSDSASAVLASLYPEIIDDAVNMSLSNEWAEAANGLYDAAEARRAAGHAYDEAKNRIVALLDGHRRGWGNGWAVNCSVTPANPGREPKPGELVGKRAETRRYTVKETSGSSTPSAAAARGVITAIVAGQIRHTKVSY